MDHHFDSNSDFLMSGIHSNHHERRPPIYNAEDYVLGLKKFSKLTGLQLYLDSPLEYSTSAGTSNGTSVSTSAENGKKTDFVRDNNRRNMKHNNNSDPNQNAQNLEMGLKQFSTITDLLIKLKDDLTLSFPSFIREFIGVPNDGVTHLLDALKSIQLAQTNINGNILFF